MSGIAGILRFDGGPIDTGLIEAMTGVMEWRGPDGLLHWSDGCVSLGQCKLNTTPESLEEILPLASPDERFILVMDGRLDNWEELRSLLVKQNIRLRNSSDAELLLQSYMLWGAKCVDQLEGDFAFVIWDCERRAAFCARDRMGNRPFHYHWDGKTFAFASEVRPLLDLPWVGQELNLGLAAEFLAMEFISRDETFWKGIYRLPPAHCLTLKPRGGQPVCYWLPDVEQGLPCQSEADYVEYYRHLLMETVRRQSRSHAPLACEVSGGLDSSAIFGVAARLEQEGRLGAPSIEGYTLDFEGQGDADELEYARAVGSFTGKAVHEIAPSDFPVSWYEARAGRSGQFPGYPNGTVLWGLRAQAKNSNCRVVFSGLGGDEFLTGSRAYYAESLRRLDGRSLIHFAGRDTAECGFPAVSWWLLRHGLYPLLPKSIRKIARSAFGLEKVGKLERTAWLVEPLRERLAERRKCLTDWSSRGTGVGQRQRLQSLTSAFGLTVRELDEQLAAENAIEVRRPFIDRQLVEFFLAAPESVFMSGSMDKVIHRRALGDLMPKCVRERATKAEFSITFAPQFLEALQHGKKHARDRSWVDLDKLEVLASSRGLPTVSAWPEFLIWTLMGCGSLEKTSRP